MSTVNAYPHLTIADDGTARIENTRYLVDNLAAEHYCYGWSAEELLRQHIDLRPEQIYSALAYFYDHYDSIVARFRATVVSVDEQRGAQKLTRAELLQRKAPGGS